MLNGRIQGATIFGSDDRPPAIWSPAPSDIADAPPQPWGGAGEYYVLARDHHGHPLRMRHVVWGWGNDQYVDGRSMKADEWCACTTVDHKKLSSYATGHTHAYRMICPTCAWFMQTDVNGPCTLPEHGTCDGAGRVVQSELFARPEYGPGRTKGFGQPPAKAVAPTAAAVRGWRLVALTVARWMIRRLDPKH